jgi:hypothetical protein
LARLHALLDAESFARLGQVHVICIGNWALPRFW